MIDKLLTKLRRYDDVSGEEEQALRAASGETREFPKGALIIAARAELSSSTLLVDGLIHSFKDLADGSRQTVQLAIPGDFIDLHSLLMKQVDHNLAALSPCRIITFPHDRLVRITQDHAHLTRLLWLSTVNDGAIEREMIMSLGIRSAVSRLAHLFCELCVRLEAVGLADNRTYDLRLTQEELSDILGMTPVHMNRMLKELRERGLLTFRGHIVDIADWVGLVDLAEFDPFYLGFRQRPR